jgi:hypothetical protein
LLRTTTVRGLAARRQSIHSDHRADRVRHDRGLASSSHANTIAVFARAQLTFRSCDRADRAAPVVKRISAVSLRRRCR